MNAVAINSEQRLYVIAFDGGVSCLGFDNARAHANDWHSGRTRYRHPSYQAPELGIKPTHDAAHPWCRTALRQGSRAFKDIGKAGAYLAFMRGEPVEPRIFR